MRKRFLLARGRKDFKLHAPTGRQAHRSVRKDVEDGGNGGGAQTVQAGYPNLLFHDLRRTAERNMTKAGMDQAMRMKISGHKTPSMSNRYNIVVAADVAEEKSKLDTWFKMQCKGPVKDSKPTKAA